MWEKRLLPGDWKASSPRESAICRIDGEKGRLFYMGYCITDLVGNCSFEEVTYLLLYGELASREELEGKIMDDALILHAEHGFNASTFTARVVASSLSTCYCSIAAAIGSLYGSLHGGANEAVMRMVEDIGTGARVRDWVTRALDNKEKIMGMGHRVYRAKDPRAVIIEEYLKQLSELKGNSTYYNILKEIESVFRERMEEKGKPIYPNVDFFSGAVYSLLGIPRILFTPIFATSRVAGWLSHILEQRVDNRIYRPRSLYTGPEDRVFQPVGRGS